MSEKMIVKNSIDIKTCASVVWDVLINPAKTKKYMFGCETVSDWKVGSDLLWEGSFEGKKMVFVKGKIVKIEPNKILKYTVIDPNASYPDIPENYLNVTYNLFEEGDKTILMVTQDGFENAADGEKRFKDSNNNGEGWNPILIEIKKLAETIWFLKNYYYSSKRKYFLIFIISMSSFPLNKSRILSMGIPRVSPNLEGGVGYLCLK